MRSQQVLELSIHILFMLLITLGVISLLGEVSSMVDHTTMKKKANLIMNKVEYNVVSLCYYSKKYKTELTEFVNLPQKINEHQYEIIGNGTHVKLIVSDYVLIREINATGYYHSGTLMKVTCNGTTAKISN